MAFAAVAAFIAALRCISTSADMVTSLLGCWGSLGDIGYGPIGDNPVVEPLGLAPAGPRFDEDEGTCPKAPEGEVDLEEGLAGGQFAV